MEYTEEEIKKAFALVGKIRSQRRMDLTTRHQRVAIAKKANAASQAVRKARAAERKAKEANAKTKPTD